MGRFQHLFSAVLLLCLPNQKFFQHFKLFKQVRKSYDVNGNCRKSTLVQNRQAFANSTGCCLCTWLPGSPWITSSSCLHLDPDGCWGIANSSGGVWKLFLVAEELIRANNFCLLLAGIVRRILLSFDHHQLRQGRQCHRVE